MNGTRPEPPLDLSAYLSTGQAAHQLRVSTEQVRRYIKAGRLTATHCGIWHVIPRTEVEALAAQRLAQEDR